MTFTDETPKPGEPDKPNEPNNPGTVNQANSGGGCDAGLFGAGSIFVMG
jgi:hypothetical protein